MLIDYNLVLAFCGIVTYYTFSDNALKRLVK